MNKLNLNCLIKISRILKKIRLKNYINELLSENMESFLKSAKDLMKRKEEETETETAKNKNENIKEEILNEQFMIISASVISWIFEQISEAENEFIDLFQAYTGEGEKAVRNWELDKVFEIFKEMFSNGLPKVITSLIDPNAVKKKLNSMMNQ